MNDELMKIIASQKGYLGIESARNQNNGITISYWKNTDSILAWKENEWHKKAIAKGKLTWYDSYSIKICKVVREYEFER
jgi:heme-degrading monooxygenase HmoA